MYRLENHVRSENSLHLMVELYPVRACVVHSLLGHIHKQLRMIAHSIKTRNAHSNALGMFGFVFDSGVIPSRKSVHSPQATVWVFTNWEIHKDYQAGECGWVCWKWTKTKVSSESDRKFEEIDCIIFFKRDTYWVKSSIYGIRSCLGWGNVG